MIKMSQTVFLPFPQSFRWKELRVKVIFSWTDVMTSNSQRLLPCPWKMVFHHRAQGFNTHTEQNTAVQPVQPWLPQLERNYLTIVSLADSETAQGEQTSSSWKCLEGFLFGMLRDKNIYSDQRTTLTRWGGGQCNLWLCVNQDHSVPIRLTVIICDSGKSDSRLDVKAKTFFT